MKLPYNVNLYNSVKRGGGYIANITDKAAGWRRTIRRVGGFWQASFNYTGNRDELDDLFFDGLMKEVREYSGGVMAWQGFIGDMTYKRGPITWQRSIFDVSNAVKVLYTQQFENLLTNGSAESGAWTPDDVDVTSTQSTDWTTDGVYSCEMDIHSGATHGVSIQDDVPIQAGIAYNFGVTIKQGSQECLAKLQRSDTGAKLTSYLTPHKTGIYMVGLSIKDTNTYTGNIDVRITNNPNTQTHVVSYGDGAYLTQVPIASDTGWITDEASISEFGRLESILLEGAMTGESALSKATTALKRQAWPRLLAPDDFGGDVDNTDLLTVTCYGYIYSLIWAINTVYTEQSASATVTALAANRDYVASVAASPNTLLFTPDNRYQISVWQVLKTLVNSGDANGNLWALGMYANRQLNYEQFSEVILYRYRDGHLYNPAGGEMEAWLTMPGWASLDDAPLVPYQTAAGLDDPRRVIIEEVEFASPDILRFRSKVID